MARIGAPAGGAATICAWNVSGGATITLFVCAHGQDLPPAVRAAERELADGSWPLPVGRPR